MSKLRVLHLADIHLGAPFNSFGARARERESEVFATFRGLVEYGLREENNVHVVVIAGDLFNSYNPKPSIVGEVKGLFRRFAEAGISVVMIPGTHDGYAYKDSVYKRYDFAPEAFVFTSNTPEDPLHLFINGQDVFFYGFAFDPMNTHNPLHDLKRIDAKGLHIGLLHCSVSDRSDIQIRKKDLPVTTRQIADFNMDYIALGHYHNYREIRDGAGKLVACYPGSPEGTKITETGDRFQVVVEFEGGEPKLFPFRCNQRNILHYSVDISGMQTQEDVLQEILKRVPDRDGIARIRMTGLPEVIPDREYLTQVLLAQFFHVDLVDDTQILQSFFVRQIEQEASTIRKLFVEDIRQRVLEASSPWEKEKLEMALKVGLVEFFKNSR